MKTSSVYLTRRTCVQVKQDEVWEVATKGLKVNRIGRSFEMSVDAEKRDAIKMLIAVQKTKSQTACQANFIAGDIWNSLKGKFGCRASLMREAFGEEMAPVMLQFFSAKGSIASAFPEPRNYNLPWTYYLRKAAQIRKNPLRNISACDFRVKCTDEDGNQTGVIVERDGDHFVIVLPSGQKHYFSVNPVRSQLYKEAMEAKSNFENKNPSAPESDAFADCAS